ncbi:tRNA-dependent cyclodipeptide synthase [archaeon]|nr:tRNA-dependent cyclodipeptide synthase [archaeon]
MKTIVERFGRVSVFIADVPAISTYIAFGYPENRARRDKAIPQGNALKNRVLKAMTELGYSDNVVRIIDWKKEIEDNATYKQEYSQVSALYNDNKKFHDTANSTTRGVLGGSKRKIKDIEKATTIAVRYLLSEFAFMEFLPGYLGVEKVIYVYHKNWKVYEDYIAGKFDGVPRPHLDFLLIENPYETYNPIWGLEDEETNGDYKDVLDRIEKTKALRVGFTNYVPALMYDRDYDNFSGIFYEIIIEIAKKHDWRVRWNEEVGYGVIIDGLDNNRFDIFGSTVWPTPERKLRANFSASLYKSPTFVWVRPDYNKTDDEIRNDANARVAVKENDITDSIAKSDFPNNRQVRVPQLSNTTEVLRFVAEDNADFTFVEPYLAEHFNKTSPIKLVKTSENPIRIYDNTFILKRDEVRLKELLDKELASMKQNGKIKQLIEKYTGSADTFIVE